MQSRNLRVPELDKQQQAHIQHVCLSSTVSQSLYVCRLCINLSNCKAHPARCGCFIPSVSAGCGAISRPARGRGCIPSAACTWSSSRSGIPVGSRGRPWGCFPAVGCWGGLNCVPICHLGLFATATRLLCQHRGCLMTYLHADSIHDGQRMLWGV